MCIANNVIRITCSSKFEYKKKEEQNKTKNFIY